LFKRFFTGENAAKKSKIAMMFYTNVTVEAFLHTICLVVVTISLKNYWKSR